MWTEFEDYGFVVDNGHVDNNMRHLDEVGGDRIFVGGWMRITVL